MKIKRCNGCRSSLRLGVNWTIGQKNANNYRCQKCRKVDSASQYQRLSDEVKERKRRECRAWSRTPRGQYLSAKKQAVQRDVPWTLTEAQFYALREKPCLYCGGPLPEAGGGLDQAVPGVGYTVENALPCCYVCNRVKLHFFSVDEMKVLGAVVRQLLDRRTG